MDLKQYIIILWRRKWAILFTVIAIMLIVIVSTREQTPKYRASVVLRIATSSNGGMSYSDYVHTTQLMNTYAEIATSRPILEKLETRVDLKYLPPLTIDVIPNTELIRISAESIFPERAAEVANSLAEILIGESSELYLGEVKSSQDILDGQLSNAQSELNYTRDAYAKLIVQTPAAPEKIETTRQLLQLKQGTYERLLEQHRQAVLRDELRSSMITIVQPALVPQYPFEPRTSLNYALGFAVGLIGGVGLAFILESQDTSLYASEDIEAIIELTEIVKIPKADEEQLSNYQNDTSKFTNAFQNLVTNLQPVKGETQLKIFLVISAEPNQGKSTIVHRLALTLAEFGEKVVTIDCDTRAPKLHTLFGLSNDSGLTDVLENDANLKDVLQDSSFENVKLLSGGTPSSYPSKLLGLAQMTDLLNELKEDFDYILLDSAALEVTFDITALLPNVDKVLLIVRRGYAHQEALRFIKKILAGTKFSDKPIDLILNQMEFDN